MATKQDKLLTERKRAHAIYLRATHHMTYTAIAASGLPCVRHTPHLDPQCDDCDPTPMWRDRSGAYTATMEALRDAYPLDPRQRDDLRREAMLTIDESIRALRPDLSPYAQPADRARAVGRITQLLARQARLLGLDAPRQLEISGDLDSEVDEQIRLLTETMQRIDQTRQDTP